MPFPLMFDALSAAIVLGGTALSTALRSGPRELRLTVRAVAGLAGPRFTVMRAKAVLSGQITAIRRDGLLRAAPKRMGDRAFDDAIAVLFRTRSLDALAQQCEIDRVDRAARADIAVRTLAQAAEMGPVFGMVGTLVALARLPAGGVDPGGLNDAISMAVVTTLYGLLLANLILAPLARAVERRAQAEECARREVLGWIQAQLEQLPGLHLAPGRALLVHPVDRERQRA